MWCDIFDTHGATVPSLSSLKVRVREKQRTFQFPFSQFLSGWRLQRNLFAADFFKSVERASLTAVVVAARLFMVLLDLTAAAAAGMISLPTILSKP